MPSSVPDAKLRGAMASSGVPGNGIHLRINEIIAGTADGTKFPKQLYPEVPMPGRVIPTQS